MKPQRYRSELTSGYWPDNPEKLVRDEKGEWVKYKDYEELKSVAEALRDWVDSVPSETVLPSMPGVDRDWVDSVLG